MDANDNPSANVLEVPWEATPEPGPYEFPAGLRALADLLEANPHMRTGTDYFHHLIPVWTREELVERVRAIGGMWVKDEHPGEYFGMTRDLGGGVTVRVYCLRNLVCERRVIGTRMVEKPAPDAPVVKVAEEVVEWVCPPSLLAEVDDAR